MNISSRDNSLSTLARNLNTRRGENFLVEFANCHADDIKAAARFCRRFNEFSSSGFPLQFHDEVKNAWRQPTSLEREVGLITVADASLRTGSETKQQDATNIAVAVLKVGLKIADRMRVCGNPECPAPYFIARKRIQKYCSETCAAPAQRELKRTWWSEHGSEWRKQRKRLQARTKRSPSKTR